MACYACLVTGYIVGALLGAGATLALVAWGLRDEGGGE